MIILMLSGYSTIHVGDNIYYRVTESTWICYRKFFRWAYEEKYGVPLMFQGGWGIKLSGVENA